MRDALLALCCAWLLAPVAAASEVQDTSYRTPDGGHVVRHEVVIEATPDEVWAALTTAAGWRTWAVPVAWGEFALGGIIETSYRADAQPGDPANIRTRVLAYLPGRMFAFQAVHAPPGFAHAELLPELFSVAELEPLDAGRTRLSLSGVGYRDTPAFDEIRRFFLQGNAWTLARLAERFRSGPVDWQKTRPPGGG